TAGGATPDADLGQVQIIHSEEEEGFPRTVTVDLSRGIEDTPLDSLATLQSKDTIVVPSLGARVGSEDKIQVLGAVRSPGAYSVKAAETVIEALSISGGPLPNADLRKVRITRPTSTGAISYQLDLYGYLHEAKPVANLELKTGDTITVPSKGRSLGTVLLDTIRLAPVITSMVSLILVLK
ncbi:MAG: SLBB domain-containing protein, partial [Candidatus Eisenbacteria sp.]|nr:SLBB domain-containing protein [Candidatus Eisenbacteria bacterium]